MPGDAVTSEKAQPRKVTVTLTRPQADALLDAAMYHATVLDDEVEANAPGALREANTLGRATARLRRAMSSPPGREASDG